MTPQVRAVPADARPEVLFLCVHNAGRSQMAAALLTRHAVGRIRVRSAGSEPSESLNPAVVQAMAEVGIDLANQRPKALTDEMARAADVVVTMGCGDACPVYPGKRYVDWDLADPAGKPLEEVRIVRDEIDGRVRALLTELTRDRVKAGRVRARAQGKRLGRPPRAQPVSEHPMWPVVVAALESGHLNRAEAARKLKVRLATLNEALAAIGHGGSVGGGAGGAGGADGGG